MPIALACLVIAVLGFWPTYFGPLLAGEPNPLPIIHVHAVVFLGWILLMILQAWLAAHGHIALHMRVGRFGFAWGVIVILVGWATTFSRFGDRVAAGDLAGARLRLLAPLTDLLVFAPLLAAAWFYRRKPELHKRLIVVGSTVLLIAAVHRMVFLGGRPPPIPQLLAVWLSPILIGMAFDYVKRKTIHPVYLTGIALVLFMKFGRAWILDTQAWDAFTGWLATFYA